MVTTPPESSGKLVWKYGELEAKDYQSETRRGKRVGLRDCRFAIADCRLMFCANELGRSAIANRQITSTRYRAVVLTSRHYDSLPKSLHLAETGSGWHNLDCLNAAC
jgi:hypothetical protein